MRLHSFPTRRSSDLVGLRVSIGVAASPAEAHLFIVNPFQGRGAGRSLANLFSTHPPTEARIARLEEIRRNLNLA